MIHGEYFLRCAIYIVCDTISSSIFVLIFPFYTKNSDTLKPCDCCGVQEHTLQNFCKQCNLVNFGDVLLRFFLKNDKK